MTNELPQTPKQINEILPPVVKKKKLFVNHKILFLFLSIVVIAAISAGTYSFIAASYQSGIQNITPIPLNDPPSPTPLEGVSLILPSTTATPTATVVPTQVVSWKNYSNTTYGYSIKYPPDWRVTDLGLLEPQTPSYIAFNPPTATASARSITVSISTRTYTEQLALGASSSAITVAGITGTKQTFKDSDGSTSTVVVLPRTNDLLVLRAKTAYTYIFDLMLTTLQVTKN